MAQRKQLNKYCAVCNSFSLLRLCNARAGVILTPLSIGHGYILIQHSLQKSSKKALCVGRSEPHFLSYTHRLTCTWFSSPTQKCSNGLWQQAMSLRLYNLIHPVLGTNERKDMLLSHVDFFSCQGLGQDLERCSVGKTPGIPSRLPNLDPQQPHRNWAPLCVPMYL